ncbi:unnamed protein product [Durusdinium trenchii]|uniref:Uncharacterized protein n=1 Tax=Durusdinium trenchii TaxID=1381693 RepID=A0ABP0MED1_9DINO
MAIRALLRSVEADLRTGLLALQWRAERSGAVKLGKSRFRSGKDLTETSDHQEGELQDLSSEPLSLAVPQLREDDSPPALRLQSLLQGLSFNVEGQTWSNSIAETPKAEIERLKSASRRAEHGDVAGPSASASPAANASADEKTS